MYLNAYAPGRVGSQISQKEGKKSSICGGKTWRVTAHSKGAASHRHCALDSNKSFLDFPAFSHSDVLQLRRLLLLPGATAKEEGEEKERAPGRGRCYSIPGPGTSFLESSCFPSSISLM